MAPPRQNVVVPKPSVAQVASNHLNLTGYGVNAEAETDAEQITTAAEAQGANQAAIADQVATIGDPQMTKDWADYVTETDPGKKLQLLEKFRNDHAAKLDALTPPGNSRASDILELESQLHRYKEALASGSLTGVGKDKALADIQTTVDRLGASRIGNSAQTRIAAMKDSNDLGKLATITQNQPGGLEILLAGAFAAGYQASYVGQMVDLPIMDVEPLSDQPPQNVTSGVYLFNPDENGGPIHYSLDATPYTMEAGENQSFGDGHVISFDSGAGETRRYTLASASYKFVIVDNTWDLRKTEFEAVLDNSAHKQDFNYVLENQAQVIPTGYTQSITSTYPIELSYDRGDGSAPAGKRLPSGTYIVGVDAKKSRLDLFDEEAVTDGPSAETIAATTTSASGLLATSPGTDAQSRAALIQEKLRKKGFAKDAAANAEKVIQSLVSRKEASKGATLPAAE